MVRILRIARNAERAEAFFGAYLAYGVALMLSGQVFINIGVNTGLLPTKGLTLPFLSYGGSSLLVCSVLLAMVLRVHHELATDSSQPDKPAKSRRASRTGGGRHA